MAKALIIKGANFAANRVAVSVSVAPMEENAFVDLFRLIPVQ